MSAVGSPGRHNSPPAAMLIEVDGLPGGNKSHLVDAIAEALDLPVLDPSCVNLGTAHHLSEPDTIALLHIAHVAHRVTGPTHGVRKWTASGSAAHFKLRFANDSDTLAAKAYNCAVDAVVCPKPDFVIRVDLSPARSATLMGGLQISELEELKEAECPADLIVEGPVTPEVIESAIAQLKRLLQPKPEGVIARMM